jgi:hypothetical protein
MSTQDRLKTDLERGRAEADRRQREAERTGTAPRPVFGVVTSTQQRLRELSEKALESAGYSRYDDGTLRPPPQTCNDVVERTLVEQAERLLTKRSPEELQEEKERLEKELLDLRRLSEMQAAGMVSKKTVMQALGLEADDGPTEAKK